MNWPEKLWTYKELSKYAGLSEGTLRKLMKNGTLPAIRMPSCRTVRFNPEQVKSVLDKLAQSETVTSITGA